MILAKITALLSPPANIAQADIETGLRHLFASHASVDAGFGDSEINGIVWGDDGRATVEVHVPVDAGSGVGLDGVMHACLFAFMHPSVRGEIPAELVSWIASPPQPAS